MDGVKKYFISLKSKALQTFAETNSVASLKNPFYIYCLPRQYYNMILIDFSDQIYVCSTYNICY